MGVQGIKTLATQRNGVGAFILQCKRLDFHYCDWAGSSRGMNALLSISSNPSMSMSGGARQPMNLTSIASRYPSTEFRVSPRPHKHPVLIAQYINGRTKAICVKNLMPEQILQKAELLLANNGEKNRRIRGKNVVSENEGVRGGWSALHGGLKNV